MTTAADPRIYPAPRKGRGAGADIEDLGPVQAPRMRIFPFFFTNSNTLRRSFSTPRLMGPGIIKGIELYVAFGVSPPNVTLEVGVATIPVLENGVANTVPRPYTVLTELLDPFNAITAAAGDGLTIGTLPSYTAHYERPLDLIVTLNEFFVVVAVPNAGVSVGEFQGKIRVLEDVNPEALALFL